MALLGVLNAGAGMAGSDSIGQSWATAYDEATGLALATSERLITASATTADLITTGAYNHETGEAAANFNDLTPPPAPPAWPVPCVIPQALPAAGDGIPEPFGWSFIKDLVGAAWPNGHQDELRAAQTAWLTTAADLRTLALRIPDALSLLNNQQSPEIPTAISTCTDRQSDLHTLADICQSLAEACGSYAHHLDEAHHQILEELKEFALETAFAETLFAVAIPLTGGLSEFGNVALAARLTYKAERVATIISELATRATAITARTLTPLTERIGPLLAKIRKWVEEAQPKLVAISRRAVPVRTLRTTSMDRRYLGEQLPGNSVWPGQQVTYLNAEERQRFQLFIRDGKMYDADGNLFDTALAASHWNGAGKAIFVMDKNGSIYASLYHGPGEFHHSSFLAGAPVAGAGELQVANGELRLITDASGHYRPGPDFTKQVIEEMRRQGLTIDPAQIITTPR
ncbi:hypothetical protein [Nocardia sp. NPDC056100]|uniref:WXG100-like domain-containing protein n=1 Tax=Nocardia sp. NPDC056100 TaxID=3345712 RepID=UPI0035DFB403